MASLAETNLATGKEKKDAADQSFRNGDIKSGLYISIYRSFEVLNLIKALLSYHQVCLQTLCQGRPLDQTLF